MEWLITCSSKKFVNVHAESISEAIQQATELMPSETISSARTTSLDHWLFASQRSFDFISTRIANYQWMMTRDIDSLTVMAKTTSPELVESVKGLRSANSETGNALAQLSLLRFRYARRDRASSCSEE